MVRLFIKRLGSQMQVQNISFGAKFISNKNIEKKINQGKKIDFPVALVQLDAHSYNDLKCVENMISDWGGFNSFTFDICENMQTVFANPPHINNSWFFYALTTQKGGYDKLNPKSILGITQITKREENSDKVKINYFETNTKYDHNAKNSKFAKIGSTLISSLKELYIDSDILAEVVDEAEGFYIKNGFVKLKKELSTFVFKRKI